ncbi:MAG: SurA N-terminal domain-containing protein, partial [Pirellulales bacterium]|nr:SurA N-terminal domain-containing protein [Pirellulales bacterium]
MSNPFSLFRKNQKAWIAGLTVAVMIGFGVLPVVMQMMGGAPQQELANPVLFTTNMGEVRASDMDHLKRQRAVINQFYDAIGPGQSPPQQLPMTDGSIADSYLFSKKAEKWGIVVDDDAVNAYIHQITDDTSQQIREALAKMKIDRSRVTEAMLFDALRHELAASQARSLYAMRANQNTFGDTPAQMWDYFGKLNRRATIEAIAVNVDDYISDVKDPTDAEVEAFFEKYRARPSSEDIYYLNRLVGNANVEGVVLESPT